MRSAREIATKKKIDLLKRNSMQRSYACQYVQWLSTDDFQDVESFLLVTVNQTTRKVTLTKGFRWT